VLSNESRPFGNGSSSTAVEKGAKPKAGKTGPRFILVSGRTPHHIVHCTSCREPIGDGYVRDIASGLLYCDYDCSNAGHSRIGALASRIRAWVVS
jgi:hypothetical protein